jgi:hypothetical protein
MRILSNNGFVPFPTKVAVEGEPAATVARERRPVGVEWEVEPKKGRSWAVEAVLEGRQLS